MNTKQCQGCHKLFLPNSPTQKYCSLKCYRVSSRKRVIGICPVCNKEFSAWPSANKKYCSWECYLAIWGNKTKTGICPICNKQFTYYPSAYSEAGGIKKYCSWDCYLTAVDALQAKTCPVCGKEFTYYPSAYATGVKIYCSRKCQRMDARIGSVCPYCGKTFWYQRSWPLVYCSMYCYRRVLREQSGEGQPPYFNYGPNWQNQRALARHRDNYTCQRCGITEEEYGRQLDVHHVIPFRIFGLERYREANKLSNLKSYCKRCHGLTEEESEKAYSS